MKGYMCSSVHCNTIYSSQDTEQPKSSLMEEWAKKMWYIYTILLSSKKEENNAICSDTDRPQDCHTE